MFYWQIPREPRAAAPPRRARRPVPTATTRARRTENESQGAWRGEFRLRRVFAKALEHRETRLAQNCRVRDASEAASAQGIRRFDNTATYPRGFFQMAGMKPP